MILAELKRTLKDRLSLTQAGLTAMKQTDEADGYAHRYLEGRVDELEVCQILVNQLDAERIEREQHPLRFVPDAYLPDEAEPNTDRHDPNRC